MATSNIPAKYIINTYFRDIASRSLWFTEGKHPCQIAMNSKDAPNGYERGLHDAGNRVIRYERRRARKFDKAVEFDCLYVQAERFLRTRDNGKSWEMANDAIVLRRSQAIVRPRKIDYCSVPAGMMLTRHTLERIYERKHLNNATFGDELKRMLSEVELRFSFALASNLFVGGNANQARAETMIPIDGGMIIFRNTHVVLENRGDPCYGARIIPAGYLEKPVVSDSQFRGQTKLWGLEANTFIIAYGATFISEDLMNNEQRAYVAEFEREYGKINACDIALRVGSRRYSHQKQIEIQPIEISQRLRYLIAVNTRAHVADVHMAIGWERDPKKVLETVRSIQPAVEAIEREEAAKEAAAPTAD